MKTRSIILCLCFLALSLSAKAETAINVRGGLSLSNNDITSISVESVQNKDSYTGWFIGPAVTIEAKRIIGVDLGVMYAMNPMKGYDELGKEKKYNQQFINIPLSLRLHFGFEKFSIIGQFGPQWNFNLNDVQTFFQDGKQIDNKKIVTTANIGAGVRLFDRLEVMLNFNCPWECVGDHFDDFSTMGDLIGKYKTIQFVFAWRF